MKKLLIGVAVLVVATLGWWLSIGQHKSSNAASYVATAGDGDSSQASTGNADAGQGSKESTASAAVGDQRMAAPVSTGPLAGRPFEAQLLTNNAVNDRALKLLQAKNFDQAVNALDAENAGRYNPVADKYRSEVESTLEKLGKQGQIDRFACGSNVCLASVRTPSDQTWFKDWYESLQPSSRLPIGALAGHDVTLPGGTTEHRILFTTQPGSAAFTVPPMPPKAAGT